MEEVKDRRSHLILVVDDDGAIRMLARAALEKDGFEVADAVDGAMALSFIKKRKPDLILLDVVMSGMDGFSVCRHIRELPDCERIPVCMMTGLDDTESIHKAYHSGATDFITKPINWLILGYRVRYILRASEALDDVYRAESKNRALLAAIPDGMLRIASDGEVLESRGFAETGPLCSAPGTHRNIYEAMPMQMALPLMNQISQSVNTGSVQILECEWAENAQLCDLEIRTVRSGDNETLSIVRDITERKRTEKALRASEERYALASLAANDGLWDWDIAIGVTHFSPRWKRLLGYAEEEIGVNIEEEWFRRIHIEDLEQVKVAINTHLEGLSTHFENEHRVLHKDGTYRWMLSKGIAVRDGEGKAYRMIGSQTDVSDRKRAEEQLLHDAFYDSLTGLPNRALFMDRLGNTLKRTRRDPDYVCAVLFLDLDRFKQINDSLGHMVGDVVLIETARRMERILRPGDTVARLGGDEFVMLIEDIGDIECAKRVADRIQKAFALPLRHEESEIFIRGSIGIALGTSEYSSAEDLLRDADITMYRAKATLGGHSEVFDPSMRQHAVALLHLETDLRSALIRDEFVLHYQPIVAIADGRIIGLEALLRWRHPLRGLMMPAEFIPLAEETGLIIPIGEWVFRTACSQMKTWMDEGMSLARIAINISQVQLLNPGFPAMAEAITKETGIPPTCVDLEIREAVLMCEATLKVLLKLKDLGVHISIDDFGTGYSSLSYLQRLPFDTLKIGNNFINRLATNGARGKFLETIVMLGEKLGIDVVAEGIENMAQVMKLQSISCPIGQGYYFSAPMDALSVKAMLPAFPGR